MINAQPTADPLATVRTALASGFPGSSAIKIAVVDGLPDLSHPALRDAEITVLEAMVPPGENRPDPHGTGVCSLIFGSGNAVTGLAPGCSGLVLPIFFGRRAESRARPASQVDLARAISFAIEQDVALINISAGQKTSTPEAETHLEQALRRCRERRVAIIAAAGNDGCSCLHIPASMETVLAVGAANPAGNPLEASNWGEPYRKNGLLAPGFELPVAVPGGGVTTASGTSFATAVVSGIAALLLSIARNEGYAVDPIDIQQILIDSAAPCALPGEGACDRYLAGRVDAPAALALLHRIGSTSTYSAGLGTAESGQINGDLGDRRQVIPKTRGESAMSNSALAPSESIAIEAPGLSPSACSCQKKPEEEAEEAVVRPQSTERAPPSAVPPTSLARITAGGVSQQACSCGGGQPPQIVFALGALWFDFGTEARYDALVQQMGDPIRVNTPPQLFAFLRENPHFASGITFILMQDQIPLYAIQPAGPFALQTYGAMFDALNSCLDESGREQRVSIPGFISGSTMLLNGMTVPVVYPDLRGMYKWRSQDLIEATRQAIEGGGVSDDEILNFLNRVYYELRNLGVAPQERAMNYAATNAYQARSAFAEANARGLYLDSIKVVKSPICRPDSDCWDVQLQMFDPENERRAGRVYRYTVDVSEVLPVTVGPVRSWSARLDTM